MEVFGVNESVRLGEVEYHVQTENLAAQAKVVSTVFLAGVVQEKVVFDYGKHLARKNFTEVLPKALRLHHETVVLMLHKKHGDDVNTPPPFVHLHQRENVPHSTIEPAAWDLLLRRIEDVKKTKKIPWDKIVEARRAEDRHARH